MITKKQNDHLEIIGANTFVEVEGIKNIPAKIDTGADSSSIFAKNISISKDNVLSFKIFGKKIETKDFKVAVVRNSTGEEQIRYRVPLKMKINGKNIRAIFSLSDRSRNNFPVLVGRRTIKGKFLVDVSDRPISPPKNSKTKEINGELMKNPYKFHKKYINSKEK